MSSVQAETKANTETETEMSWFCPPPEPPPLLEEDQLVSLAHQGWLSIGLSPSVDRDISTLSSTLSTFFDQPESSKASLYPEKHGTELGYYHVPNEKEYVTLRHARHADSELEIHATKVWSSAAAMLHRILVDISRALSLPQPATIWNDILDGTLALPESEQDMSASHLRLFRYFPGSGFAGSHTDLGLLTLCVGDGKGLQLLDREASDQQGEMVWVDATGPVVLVGQTLRALSNGLFRPGVHRVVPNPNGRHSIVFAVRHSFRHNVDLVPFGGQGQIEPRLLWKKLKVGVLNINARKEIREAQRKVLDERKKKMVIGAENQVELSGEDKAG